MANFEVIGYKKGLRTVKYYTLPIYAGIAVDIADRMRLLGYKKIQVRMI